MNPLFGGRNTGDFGCEPQVDTVSAVKIVRNNADAFLTVPAREETFGERRAFVGYGVLRGDDGQVAGLEPQFGQLLGGVTGDHAAAQNHEFRSFHDVLLTLCTAYSFFRFSEMRKEINEVFFDTGFIDAACPLESQGP